MKILQTSDWHLGKIFYETSLYNDQKYFLDQITEELEKAKETDFPYDAIIVPGDIYDRPLPSAESVDLFSKFLTTIRRKLPNLHMFFISGNHDSPQRLSFVSQLLENENIHICTDCNRITEPVVIKKNGETTAVYQIPFLLPGAISRNDNEQQDLFSPPLRNQQELVAEAVHQIADVHKRKYGNIPSVLCAHLFTLGAITPESPQYTRGTVDQVSADLFAPFTHTALGHIHKVQKCGSNSVWYSGSPLAYSFDDVPDKYLLCVTINDKTTDIRKIPIQPLHPVVRLEGPFEQFYSGNEMEQYREYYVEIRCTDSIVTENPMALLRKKFPYLLSFTRKTEVDEKTDDTLQQRKRLLSGNAKDNLGDIFDLFISDMYGSVKNEKELLDQEKKLFLDLSEKETNSE